ncbi:hypothetical protein AK812_SmicGene40454 [Symbiodinium microadriaticum]|uniref:Uncharacterized protein n=1 Tax=Symbiodinium microadriaticum TaxID=2951 RepID=A0A1Q9C8M3_SYMMI|nr:hypothetical protein AK812_SmicGene40454 [Symbiodinium microadriaticum]
MDATVKVCLKLVEQEAYLALKAVRDTAPFGDDAAWHGLLTARDRPGAVLLLHRLQNESSEQLVGAFAENFSTDQLGNYEHLAIDSPLEKLYAQLRVVCPKLGCLMLDTIHLAIVYEMNTVSGKKKRGLQAVTPLRRNLGSVSPLIWCPRHMY